MCSLKRLDQNSICDPKGQRLLVYRQILFVVAHVWKDEGMEAGQRAGVSFFLICFCACSAEAREVLSLANQCFGLDRDTSVQSISTTNCRGRKSQRETVEFLGLSKGFVCVCVSVHTMFKWLLRCKHLVMMFFFKPVCTYLFRGLRFTEILECIYWSTEFSQHKLRGLRTRGDNHSPRAAGFVMWACEHAGFPSWGSSFKTLLLFFPPFIMSENVAPNRRESSSTRMESLRVLFTF